MPQKIELVVSGGFTGVGGKWTIDTDREVEGDKFSPTEVSKLNQLVAGVRQKNLLGRDFTQLGPQSPPVADSQMYELTIDGQSVKWNEPASDEAAEPPEVLGELKDWIRQNGTRQPPESR